MTMLELAVLKVEQPERREDEWQTFRLKDVKAYKPEDSSKYVSILMANSDCPIVVKGTLEEIKSDQRGLVIEKDYRKMPITIAGITKYSFGKSENGEYSIWVAGQAGWYTVAPAPEYRTIYNESIETMKIFHFLKDFYADVGSDSKANKLRVSEQVVLEKYVNDPKTQCSNFSDAVKVFRRHHKNLLKIMEQRIAEPKGIDRIPWEETTIFRWFQFTASKSVSNVSAVEPAKAVYTEFEIVRTAHPDLGHEDLSFEGLASRMSLSFADEPFKDRREISDYLVTHAREIVLYLRMMSSGPRFTWKRAKVYQELQAVPKTSVSHHTRQANQTEEIGSTQRRNSPNNKRKHGQLRLQHGSFGSKAVARKTANSKKAPQDSPLTTDGENADMDWQISSPDDSVLHSAKKLKEVQDRFQSAGSLSVSSDEEDFNDGASLSTAEKPISLYDTRDDIWTCPIDGCLFKVRESSLVANVYQIQDHVRHHARDDLEENVKLNTVYTESRSHLPVSHLVDKIRSMASSGSRPE